MGSLRGHVPLPSHMPLRPPSHNEWWYVLALLFCAFPTTVFTQPHWEPAPAPPAPAPCIVTGVTSHNMFAYKNEMAPVLDVSIKWETEDHYQYQDTIDLHVNLETGKAFTSMRAAEAYSYTLRGRTGICTYHPDKLRVQNLHSAEWGPLPEDSTISRFTIPTFVWVIVCMLTIAYGVGAIVEHNRAVATRERTTGIL